MTNRGNEHVLLVWKGDKKCERILGVISDVGISLISLVLKILSFLKWNLRVAEHG